MRVAFFEMQEPWERDYLEQNLEGRELRFLTDPLTTETRHLVDRERFGLMKRGTLLINTARGPLVDTEALLWALDEGIVAGAGLDVLEGEEVLAEERHMFRTPDSEAQLQQIVRGHQLLGRENVIITPHMAWYSREARQRILETTAGNIAAFVAGRPANVVARPAASSGGRG